PASWQHLLVRTEPLLEPADDLRVVATLGGRQVVLLVLPVDREQVHGRDGREVRSTRASCRSCPLCRDGGAKRSLRSPRVPASTRPAAGSARIVSSSARKPCPYCTGAALAGCTNTTAQAGTILHRG